MKSLEGNSSNTNYLKWVSEVNEVLQKNEGPFFQTSLSEDHLWKLYLGGFADEDIRQYHNCNACKKFIQRYGGLVTISGGGGSQNPVLWTPYILEVTQQLVPELYPSISQLAKELKKTPIAGVFLSSEKVWGVSTTGPWSHLCVEPKNVFTNKLQTASQAMAEKDEDFKIISRALSEWTVADLEFVEHLAKSDSLYRGEKILGQASWLVALKRAVVGAKEQNTKKRIIWKAVATAPAGFCHPRSSMIGTLLEDLQNMPSEEAAERFKQKMNPLQYQRPTSITEGNIRRAEEIVKKLGIVDSLHRRFAAIDELEYLWTAPVSTNKESSTVFGHLLKSAGTPLAAPIRKITARKFLEEVLPEAHQIEFRTGHQNYVTFITEAIPGAPPILQWDHEHSRNPVSWFVWMGGSSPSDYKLPDNALVKVLGVTNKPPFWKQNKSSHFGEGLIFVLEGAEDLRNNGNGLFPEILKKELREVSPTIVKYSREATILPVPDGKIAAAGYGFFKDGSESNELVVTMNNGIRATYILDRWD